MNELKKLLNAECYYRMKDETMDLFLGIVSDQVELKESESLIPYGKFDDSVYILKSGIIRYVYFDGAKEVTFSFSSPGTVMISYYSFYMHEPSFQFGGML